MTDGEQLEIMLVFYACFEKGHKIENIKIETSNNQPFLWYSIYVSDIGNINIDFDSDESMDTILIYYEFFSIIQNPEKYIDSYMDTSVYKYAETYYQEAKEIYDEIIMQKVLQ